MAKAIGVDIGGTGIKAGLVDLEHGIMASDRVRAVSYTHLTLPTKA